MEVSIHILVTITGPDLFSQPISNWISARPFMIEMITSNYLKNSPKLPNVRSIEFLETKLSLYVVTLFEILFKTLLETLFETL